MKITCHCGHLIPDQTDGLPHKTHLVPDEDWFPLLDGMDVLVADLAAGKIGGEAAAMGIRGLLVRSARAAYRCTECGRLLMEGMDGRLRSFLPEAPDKR